MATTVGFVGVGDMGASMAERALKSNAEVWVYDINPTAVADLVSRGAHAADSLAALCARTDQVHIVVVTDSQLRSVCAELVAVARPGTRLVVHSTVHPDTCRSLAEDCVAHGLALLDAPVSGSTAKSHGSGGSLVAFVGADRRDLEASTPGLETFVTKIFHVGQVGNGQLVKLANNLVAITNSVVLKEGVRLASLAGLDAADFIGLIKDAAGDSWAAEHGFASRVWRGLADPATYSTGKSGFTAVLQKDLGLALQVGTEAGLELPVLATSIDNLPTLLD